MKEDKTFVIRFDRLDYPDNEKFFETIRRMVELFDSEEVKDSMHSDLSNPLYQRIVVEINYPYGYNVIPEVDYQKFLRLSDLPF